MMPTGDNSARDRPERWAVVTKTILPAVTALRQHVGMTEAIFRTQTFHSLPREFFLWTALDEVMKTGVCLMRLDEFLGEDQPERASPEDAHPTGRAIEAILLEEERLRARRLCELLVQLVLFGRKDTPELYGHFLLLEDLVRAQSYNGDLAEFYGVSSDWVRATVDRTVTELHGLEPKVNVSDAAWYANPVRPVRAASSRTLLTSARQRLILALPLMTDLERLALGTTYHEAFGEPSEAIHYRAGADPVDHARESTVAAEGTKLGLIALCVVRRIQDRLGSPAVAELEQLNRVFDTNQEPSRMIESLTSRAAIAVGDFVAARGYLGQVVDERVSRFGYRSLRVDFLAERPLQELAGDWFRVRDVVRLFSKQTLVAGVREKMSNPTAVVENESLRASAISAWSIGLRDQVRAGKRSE
jgi:hypothetical protein